MEDAAGAADGGGGGGGGGGGALAAAAPTAIATLPPRSKQHSVHHVSDPVGQLKGNNAG
jgi:hypothetical protein